MYFGLIMRWLYFGLLSVVLLLTHVSAQGTTIFVMPPPTNGSPAPSDSSTSATNPSVTPATSAPTLAPGATNAFTMPPVTPGTPTTSPTLAVTPSSSTTTTSLDVTPSSTTTASSSESSTASSTTTTTLESTTTTTATTTTTTTTSPATSTTTSTVPTSTTTTTMPPSSSMMSPSSTTLPFTPSMSTSPSSASPESLTQDDSKTMMIAILGSILGAIAAAALITALCLCCCRSRVAMAPVVMEEEVKPTVAVIADTKTGDVATYSNLHIIDKTTNKSPFNTLDSRSTYHNVSLPLHETTTLTSNPYVMVHSSIPQKG